jgi:hypothetical protein
MLTEKELNELAKQLLEARMQTDNALEEKAIDAGVAAIVQMRDRAKKEKAA